MEKLQIDKNHYGFIIEDSNHFEIKRDYHLRINLTEDAYKTILSDKNVFQDNKELTLSGFLNRIFENFYTESHASINAQLIKYKKSLDELVLHHEDEKNTNLYKSLLNKKFKELVDEFNNRMKKGIGKNIRLNDENLTHLKESGEQPEKDGMPIKTEQRYLKAIFEEYAELPQYKRELIYYHNIVSTLIEATNPTLRCAVKISLNNSLNNIMYLYKPALMNGFPLIHDAALTKNYLIGFSKIMNDENSIYMPVSFRLSNIKKISLMKSESGIINKTNYEILINDIKNKGPEFLASKLIDIQIKFTPDGLKKLKQIIFMRPKYIINMGDYYLVKCTYIQAFYYFQRFGKDAVIIEPKDLKDDLLNYYTNALESYKNIN